MEILWFSPFWSDRSGPGRLRNLNIPIGILRFPARAGQGSLRTSKIWFCIKISGNFMKMPKILVWNQYFHEKSDLAVPGEEYEHYNHWKSIGITVFFACQRCGAEILRNARKSWKFMKIHEFSWNFMISNGNHDILCFQPSATRHETLIFLREKQGLSSLALQGARKTEIWVKFQKFHETSWSFKKFHKNSWISRKSCFGVLGSE